jgi:class 3 adenylate cyclase
MGELSEGFVTLLASDAEAISAPWAEHPQATIALLKRHEDIFRAAVADNTGFVYAIAGDSCWAAFSDPADAVAAALAAQDDQAIRSESSHAGLPLRARMALHTGPARREGVFYAGPSVSRVSALLATGYRSQVMMTEADARAVQDQLPSRASLRNLGRHRLLDSEEREAVFELLAPELETQQAARVVATILFTDVVDSTDRAVAIGDEHWRAELTKHHELLRQNLARFGGKEIRSTGDGICAVFTSPASAIECAYAMTVAVSRLGLDIRAGIQTGECDVADDTIHGLAVHIAARVAGWAGASEVVVSSTVKELVAGSGISFEDRVVYTLKGLTGDWRLFSVARQRD